MVASEARGFQPIPPDYQLVVATGNPRKAAGYAEYPVSGSVQSLDPEEHCGVSESESSSAAQVAMLKADAVRTALAAMWPEGHRHIIVANDVITRHAKTREGLTQPGKHRELFKLDRYLAKIKSAESRDKFTTWAVLDTLELFCNGQFFVMWELGTSIQVPAHGIRVAADVRIVAGFNPLDESEVFKAFDDGTAYGRGPRVPLAELAESYAIEVYIDESDAREQLMFEELQKLVIQGVMPWQIMATYLQPLIDVQGGMSAQTLPLRLTTRGATV